ncbi:hypothetical protein [Anatilimnocola floriformis]|uniref:hypothetical protein n=1 Tax=Anatilimnocola floriformis TaxID=2948575 RepID=UPI0020C3FB06|nr:hypothetical protein [Anatilimnocola floriformis]
MPAIEEDWLHELDEFAVPFEQLGCFAAISTDRTTLFWCPMLLDGTPEVDDTSSHSNWGEVTAPTAQFLRAANKAFGTKFRMREFAGR